MIMRKLFTAGGVGLLMIGLAACSGGEGKDSGAHRGERLMTHEIGRIDSVTVTNLTSGMGNFFMYDSLICFADVKDALVRAYSAASGDSVTAFLGLGGGPTEINSLDRACPVLGSPEPMWIVFSREYDIYGFYPARDSLVRYGRVGIQRIADTSDAMAYGDPHNYAVTGDEMIMIGDTAFLAPVDPMLDETNELDAAQHFASARTLGAFNPHTAQLDTLLGRLPEVYSKYPSRYFVNHSVAPASAPGRYFVNFAEDSLIQCMEYPDRLVYEFGYDAPGADRQYSGKFLYDFRAEWDDFKRERASRSFSTGLYYDAADDILLRTVTLDNESGRTVVQAYKDADLIAEAEMPPYFRIIGKHGARYYGVRRMPVSDEEETIFTFYSFSLDPKP